MRVPKALTQGSKFSIAAALQHTAARGLGAEMSARSRGLVERMGEVSTVLWRSTAEVFDEPRATRTRDYVRGAFG